MVVVKKNAAAPYGYEITDGANMYALTERAGKEGTGDFNKVKLPSWCGHKLIHMDKIRTVENEADIESLYTSAPRSVSKTSAASPYGNMRSAVNCVSEIVKYATKEELDKSYKLDTISDILSGIVDRYEETSKQEHATNTLSALLAQGLTKEQLTVLLASITATDTDTKDTDTKDTDTKDTDTKDTDTK